LNLLHLADAAVASSYPDTIHAANDDDPGCTFGSKPLPTGTLALGEVGFQARSMPLLLVAEIASIVRHARRPMGIT
jgi:hypothetical protein